MSSKASRLRAARRSWARLASSSRRTSPGSPWKPTSASAPSSPNVSRPPWSPSPSELEDLDQVVEVVGPQVPVGARHDGLDGLRDSLLVDERLVARDQQPVARRAAFITRLVEIGELEPELLGDREDHGFQVEEAVGHMECDDAGRLHVPQVKLHGLVGDEVHRYRISGEGVDGEHVEL